MPLPLSLEAAKNAASGPTIACAAAVANLHARMKKHVPEPLEELSRVRSSEPWYAVIEGERSKKERSPTRSLIRFGLSALEVSIEASKSVEKNAAHPVWRTHS